MRTRILYVEADDNAKLWSASILAGFGDETFYNGYSLSPCAADNQYSFHVRVVASLLVAKMNVHYMKCRENGFLYCLFSGQGVMS